MEINIEDRTKGLFQKEYKEFINKAILATLNYEGIENIGDISVSIVTDQEIKGLNKKYRGIDRATDVLSFPLIEDFEEFKDDTKELSLGDVIISIEKAFFQAEEYGHSLQRELGFLVVHSVLHLIGYDHINLNDEKIMLEKQENILKMMSLER